MARREILDESTITVNGKTKTLREHLVATEGKADGEEFSRESGRFVSALRQTKRRGKVEPQKPKAVYSRRLTPSEIAEEEIRIMASQSLKSFKFLLAHPNEWLTAKQVCEGIGEEPKTASPTVSRIALFFEKTEPDMMLTQQVGRAREMMFKATADDVDEWSQRYNEKYVEWLREYTKAQREARIAGKGEGKGRKPTREVKSAPIKPDSASPEQIKASMRSFDPGQKITLEVTGSIKILFGFTKGD